MGLGCVNLLLVLSGLLYVANANPYSVKPSAALPSVDHPFNLTCDGATPGVTIIWLRDGEPLTLNSWMSLSPDNITLSFRRLQTSDSKQFQCKVFNGSSSVISKDYWIDFKSYTVKAARPSATVVGIESVFTCTAECGVFCTTQWAPPITSPKGKFFSKGPELRWTPSEAGQTQVFTCDAVNPSLGKLSNVTINVTVEDFKPLPRPNNAISVTSSAAAVICATLLMLICAWT